MHIYRELKAIPIPEFAYVSHNDFRVYVSEKISDKAVRTVIGRSLPDNDMLMYPNENFRILYPKLWAEHYGKKDLKPQQIHFGLYLAILVILHSTGLYSTLIDVYGIEITNAVIDFSMYSILEKSSVVHAYKDKMFDHATFSNVIHGDHWFSDLFNIKMSEDKNIEFKNNWLMLTTQKYKIEKVKAGVAVDGSNNDCSADSDLCEKGFAKSHTNNDIVGYTWVNDTIFRRPLTYYVTRGSIPDCKTIFNITTSLDDVGLDVEELVLDKNYSNHSVIRELDSLGLPYLINLKSSCFAHKEMVNEYNQQLSSWNPEYSVNFTELSGITEKRKIFEKYPEEGYIHTFFDHHDGNERRLVFYKKILNEVKLIDEKIMSGLIPTIKKEFKNFFQSLKVRKAFH